MDTHLRVCPDSSSIKEWRKRTTLTHMLLLLVTSLTRVISTNSTTRVCLALAASLEVPLSRVHPWVDHLCTTLTREASVPTLAAFHPSPASLRPCPLSWLPEHLSKPRERPSCSPLVPHPSPLEHNHSPLVAEQLSSLRNPGPVLSRSHVMTEPLSISPMSQRR